jgi:dienelactone hydrolase
VKTYDDDAGHSLFSRVGGWQGMLVRVPTGMAVGYAADAAEDGWKQMLAFFAEHVGAGEPART